MEWTLEVRSSRWVRAPGVAGPLIKGHCRNRGPSPYVHWQWVDLHGLGNGNPPQYILNVSDMGQILKAFAGDAWTDDPGNMNPGQCP